MPLQSLHGKFSLAAVGPLMTNQFTIATAQSPITIDMVENRVVLKQQNLGVTGTSSHQSEGIADKVPLTQDF
ncbi:MAG: hypothetical protein AAF702_40080 [Chloroflexota bacterium]